jgi:hypothetical protein
LQVTILRVVTVKGDHNDNFNSNLHS